MSAIKSRSTEIDREAHMLEKVFLQHPHSVGETYFEHLRSALSFALAMALAGTCCAIHAFVPALFEKMGSATIARLHDRMIANRAKLSANR